MVEPRRAGVLLLTVALGLCSPAWSAQAPEQAVVTAEQKALDAIARAIEARKPDFPQLASFSAARNLRADALTIDYSFKTHKPEGRGGWTSGVPNPDPDGVWFYIDIHSPDSMAQIHTQPMVEQLCFGKMRVQFLSLEGAKTKRVVGSIRAILLKNGVTRCPR